MANKSARLTIIVLLGSLVMPGTAQTSLKDAFKESFLTGVAVNRSQIYGEDARGVKIIETEFNSITPENVLKWESVHPQPDIYDFAGPDRYVQFGERNHMVIIGHTLVWHRQTPKWVFEDDQGNPVSRDVLLRRMQEHIQRVVGRYKGRIKGWDVVNEAVDEDGRLRASPWLKLIGEDYIEKAFEYAHEADPKAQLYYNDYGLENEPKRQGAIALIMRLKAKGIPVYAIGLQGHDDLEWPSVEQQEVTIATFEQLGLKVNISELDISVLPSPIKQPAADTTATLESQPEWNHYLDGLPETVREALAMRYAELFAVFVKHSEAIERVTFWGVTDTDSWRNDWPIRGRADYPLLFDRNGVPKGAFEAVLHSARAVTAHNKPGAQSEGNEERCCPPPACPRLGTSDGVITEVSTDALQPSRVSIEERVNNLVGQMTLKEKVSQLGHTADAIPRLGIPQYDWWNEGLHGVARAGNATVFPQAIGMAAMFDEPLMHQIADVISTEFRAKYAEAVHPDGSSDWYRGLTVWSPNINIFRDPRWGRGQETYGEDPYLTSRLGLAFVTGLQGDDPKYLKTVATPKHFAVHSGPELTRHTVNVSVSKHDMEDTYLPAFRMTVTDGKAGSVMCAYNSVNGQPACANDDLLKTHLRGVWGFRGYVVSDCGAITDVFAGHRYKGTIEEAAGASFQAGTDLVCGVPPQEHVKYEEIALEKAVERGVLPESVLDQALRRLFTARFRLGLCDPPATVPWSKITPAENDTEEHRQLALKAARESVVLLKNENNFLPLKGSYKTIAVIGPNADSVDALVGNYNGTPSKPRTLLAAIKKRFPDSNVSYAQGVGLTGPATEPVPREFLNIAGDQKEQGLKAEYYSNTELSGPPVISRTDPAVNFEWGYSGVTSTMVRNFSVRWTGVLVPPTSGDYLIGFTGEDGYRVWLDGKVVVEDWTAHHPATTVTKQMRLEAGHAYPLKIEYYQIIRAAEARLIWSILGKAEQEAIEAARKADLVVATLGLSPRIEGEEMKVDAEGFAGGDRTKLDLPAAQEKLLERVYAQGKPMVLVLMGGSAIAVNWADEKLPAILEAWYPGEEGGTAIAEALGGDYSPGGRLPVTFYKSLDQLPAFEDYSMARRTYRYFSGDALYPFGYGLSYTSFAYRNVKVDPTNVASNGTVNIFVDLANVGKATGDEVVQLYLTHTGVPGAPLRALQGFRRVHLDPGQTTTVIFHLTNRQLSIVDEAGKRRILPGEVAVWVGGGQPVSRSGLPKPPSVQTQFSIVGEAVLPD
jgi:beta-glucosidase